MRRLKISFGVWRTDGEEWTPEMMTHEMKEETPPPSGEQKGQGGSEAEEQQEDMLEMHSGACIEQLRNQEIQSWIEEDP